MIQRPVRRSQTRPNASSPLTKQFMNEYCEPSSLWKQADVRGQTTELPRLCGRSLTQCQPKSHLDGRQCHTHPCCGPPNAGSPLELPNPISAMMGHSRWYLRNVLMDATLHGPHALCGLQYLPPFITVKAPRLHRTVSSTRGQIDVFLVQGDCGFGMEYDRSHVCVMA